MVPIQHLAKNPAVKWEPYKEKRATLQEIGMWWGYAHANAQAHGLGIVTGKISSNVVLDFDPVQGATPEQLITEAEAFFGKKFPETCRVLTAGGGYHDHFFCLEPVQTKTSFFKGKYGHIELRGDSAIIVMPPTMARSKRNPNNGIGMYTYIRPMQARVEFDSTWMIETEKESGLLTVTFDVPEEIPPMPTTDDISTTLKACRIKLNTRAIALLDSSYIPEDRSKQCYDLGCEVVRSNIHDPEIIAKLIMSAPYHQEKYGPRPLTSPWGAWGHAYKLALRVLEDTVILNPLQAPVSISTDGNGKKAFKVYSMDEIPEEDAKFLIYPYLPRGEVTMLDGDPDAGKSWVWMALTAGLTGSTICTLPYDKTAIQNAKVLILTHEDNAKVTLKKRLKLMGARLNNIQTIAVEREVPEDDDEYSGLQGINANDLLEASPIIKSLHPDLIIIDPLVLFTSTLSSFDSDKGNRVRELFNQIQVLTRQIGCAFLIVRHFRKQGAQKAIHRGVGSIDHVAAARSVLIVAQNKDNGDRYISHAKSNLAPKGPTITYTLNENDHPPFQWVGTDSNITADQLTDDYSNAKDGDAKDAKDDAIEFLQGELEDGPVPTAELIKRAGSLKITQAALNKAKKELKILSRKMKEEGKTAVWVMELPKKCEPIGGDA